jgi:hypothetical protein
VQAFAPVSLVSVVHVTAVVGVPEQRLPLTAQLQPAWASQAFPPAFAVTLLQLTAPECVPVQPAQAQPSWFVPAEQVASVVALAQA